LKVAIVRDAISFCRICGVHCGVRLTIDDAGSIMSIRGDKDHPLTAGFACGKGVDAPEMYRRSDRVLRPLKRQSNGGFSEISLDQATQEIADRLIAIIDRDGPEAIATYQGTAASLSPTLWKVMPRFMQAIGSPSRFTALTIDNSSMVVRAARMGSWAAGKPRFEQSDVWLLFGANPLVSFNGQAGVTTFNALKYVKAAKARGMKLIVVDPRRTETALHADMFLQVRPGHDAALAACILKIIIDEDLQDKEFCAAHADGMDRLIDSVRPFEPELIASRVDVPIEQIYAAARTFAGPGKAGCASFASGITMTRHSNLADHMIELLNVVCGRFLRAGDIVSNTHPLYPEMPIRAEVVRVPRWWETGHKLRSGHGMLITPDGGELPTTLLSDEILTPGKGQIKALISAGGNPVSAFPDQRKTVAAVQALDLLVAVEPFLTATARVADYVIPPRLMYERADIPIMYGDGRRYPTSFAQYTPPVADVPPGSDLTEDWRFFWDLARRMDRAITINDRVMDMDQPPTTDELMDMITAGGRVSLDEVRQYPHGMTFPHLQTVEGARSEARFDVLPDDVADELRCCLVDEGGHGAYPYLLINRRVRNSMNSLNAGPATARSRKPYNPAYLNPADMAGMGLRFGDRIEIESEAGKLIAIAESDETLRQGVLSMTHCWGGLPDDPVEITKGAVSTALLIDSENNLQPINAMPKMTAVPIRIRPIPA
jgi:anaerobic selenocysteine-containing dehydrogenase